MGRYTSVVKLIKSYMTWVEHAERVTCNTNADIDYDMRQWTQKDLTNFASAADSFGLFELLVNVAAAATKKVKGTYTKEAIQAQNALNYLKPRICIDWLEFYKMITLSFKETAQIRTERKLFEKQVNRELQKIQWQRSRLGIQ